MNWKWAFGFVACLTTSVGCTEPSTSGMPVATPSAVTTAKERATLKEISTIIAGQMNVDKAKLQGTTSLTDLGYDDLDFVELIMELEEKFDIYISDEKFDALLESKDRVKGIKNVTLTKIADLVDSELARKPSQRKKPN